jgi:lipopolysaccharide transport system permease protein
MTADTSCELLIRPRSGWQWIDAAELWSYRELFGYLVWRDIRIRYKQTLLGGLWAVLQPLLAMLIFGMLRRVVIAGVSGPPYMLFVYTGLVPWMFFANSVTLAGNSMIGNESLIRKVYFPRCLIPLAAIAALLVDLLIGLGFTGVLMAYYRWAPPLAVVLVPLFLAGTFLAAAGLGMFLAALNVQFRDVKYAVPFLLQMGLFVTPVIYPLSRVPGKLRFALSLNPMAGLVEGWRAALLGGPIAWQTVGSALGMSAALFVVGVMFFHRMERRFADVI